MLTKILNLKMFILTGKMISLIYYVFNIRSKSIVKKNLKDNHIKFSIKLYLNFAHFLCENIYLLNNELNEDNFVLHNIDILKKSLSTSNGVMLISFHYGAWDMAGQFMAKAGYPINVIYETKEDWIYTYIDELRKKYNMSLIDRDAPISTFMNILKKGQILTVFIDQKSENLRLNKVKFLNIMKHVPSGWFELLKITKATPIISYTQWKDKKHHIYFIDSALFSFKDYYAFIDKTIRKDIYQYDFYDQIWNDIGI